MPPRSRAPRAAADAAARLRRFTRFYTRRFGVLEPAYLATAYTVTQARVLYELGSGAADTASDLVALMGLNPGYISRVVAAFERDGLLRRDYAAGDRRRRPIRLTAAGRRVFATLDARSQRQAEEALAPLAPADRAALVDALETIERFLADRADPAAQPR